MIEEPGLACVARNNTTNHTADLVSDGTTARWHVHSTSTVSDLRQQIILQLLPVLPCKTGLKKDELILTGFT